MNEEKKIISNKIIKLKERNIDFALNNSEQKDKETLNNCLIEISNPNSFQILSNYNPIKYSESEIFLNNYSNTLIEKEKNFFNIINSNNIPNQDSYKNINNEEFYKKKKNIPKKKKFIVNHENQLTFNNMNKDNEVKVFKNNKIVYINSYLLNFYSSSRKLKKANKIAFIGTTKRSSKYRGVSKNGNQWQVLIMHNKNKLYFSKYSSEEIAARVYDILAIKKRGINARTNFKYDIAEMQKISEMNIDLKAKNINEIIDNLFNYK